MENPTVTETTVAADAADVTTTEGEIMDATDATTTTEETMDDATDATDINDADATDADADATTDATDGEKAKRPYFAVYHFPALKDAVDAARGEESANTFIARLLCEHFSLTAPAKSDARRKYATKEEAKAAAEKRRKEEAAKVKAVKAFMANAMAEKMAAMSAALARGASQDEINAILSGKAASES